MHILFTIFQFKAYVNKSAYACPTSQDTPHVGVQQAGCDLPHLLTAWLQKQETMLQSSLCLRRKYAAKQLGNGSWHPLDKEDHRQRGVTKEKNHPSVSTAFYFGQGGQPSTWSYQKKEPFFCVHSFLLCRSRHLLVSALMCLMPPTYFNGLGKIYFSTKQKHRQFPN